MERKRAKVTDAIKVHWDSRPRASQGITIERVVRGHLYSRHVGPSGVLTPPEAARALGVTREFIYRLIWARKLKTVSRSGLVAIPLSSVKTYDLRRRKRRPGTSRTKSGRGRLSD
jgi:excisionase family DNA binding protein